MARQSSMTALPCRTQSGKKLNTDDNDAEPSTLFLFLYFLIYSALSFFPLISCCLFVRVSLCVCVGFFYFLLLLHLCKIR